VALPAASELGDELACPRCHSELLTVSTKVVGELVTLVLCQQCGYSRWPSEDESHGFQRVLDRVRAADPLMPSA
jgi:transcription elongation factor Elf1